MGNICQSMRQTATAKFILFKKVLTKAFYDDNIYFAVTQKKRLRSESSIDNKQQKRSKKVIDNDNEI